MTEERRDPPGGQPGRWSGPGAYPGERQVPDVLQPSPGLPPRPAGQSGAAPDARSVQTGAEWPAGVPGAARPPQPARPSPGHAVPTPATTLRRGPRRARLTLKRVDPWSVLKVTFVFSLAMLIVGVVAVIVLYVILGGMGVFDSISSFLQDVSPGSQTVSDYAPLYKVAGGAVVIGVVNVVLMTALATLGAFVYNLCADLVGGVEVTLTERE